MNLRSKIALIFQKKDKTVRKIEEETGIPKSTAHHHKHQIIKRNQFEESLFWETQAGLGFLRRLVAAAVYTFCIKGGLGAGRAREFFGLIRIGTHVGISESSIFLIISVSKKIANFPPQPLLPLKQTTPTSRFNC